MSFKNFFKFYSEIIYDSRNSTYFFDDYIEKIIKIKKIKNLNFNYLNDSLKNLHQKIINSFLSPTIDENDNFMLEIENINKEVINIDFKITKIEDGALKEPIVMLDIKSKNNLYSCFELFWVPRIRYFEIANLFLVRDSETNKILNLDINKKCKVNNFPLNEKGDFMLKIIEDIAKIFNTKYIGLMDYSTITIEKCNINLALYYIKKYGQTYYMKYGFRPLYIQEEEDITCIMLRESEIVYDDETIEKIKKKLNKFKLPTDYKSSMNFILKTNKIYPPKYYLKKLIY